MMLPNAAAPTTGADSMRPLKPWQIYMLRGKEWVPVGAVGDRALGQAQLATLRRIMPRHQFDLRWEGQADE